MTENTTIRLVPRTCATDHCNQPVPFEGHRFCERCVGTVLRMGRPPTLLPEPRWLTWTRAHNDAKDLTGHAA